MQTNITIFDNIETVSSPIGSLYDSGYLKGESDDSSVEFASFSGGGVAGFGYVGILKEMERRGLYRTVSVEKEVKYWVGSSAGAISATFGALGTSPDYILDLFLKTDLRIFLDYGGRSSSSKNWWAKFQEYRYGIFELLSKWGAVRGDKFREWFREQLAALGWDPHLTFAELYNQTGRHLVVTTTSLNTFETLYLSRSSYPNMEIVEAVDKSIRIPFLFQPIRMKDPLVPQGDRILVDGGILDNLPINACDVISETGEILAFNRKAIGFTFMHNGKWVPDYVEVGNLMKYSLTFIQALHKQIQAIQSQQPYFWDRVVPIETHGVAATDFEAGRDKLLKLVESGEAAAKKFFDQREQMIRNYGPLPRNLFIPSPRLRYNGIKYISDDLIENSRIYQTNPSRSRK